MKIKSVVFLTCTLFLLAGAQRPKKGGRKEDGSRTTLRSLSTAIKAKKIPIILNNGKRIIIGIRSFALRDNTASSVYIKVTPEMLTGGYWDYIKQYYSQFGFIPRGLSHLPTHGNEKDNFPICLDDSVDKYLMHNIISGKELKNKNQEEISQATWPTLNIQGTLDDLRLSFCDGNDCVDKRDSLTRLTEMPDLSISETLCGCEGDNILNIHIATHNKFKSTLPGEQNIEPIVSERNLCSGESTTSFMPIVPEAETEVPDNSGQENETTTGTPPKKKKTKREDDCSSECDTELEGIQSVIDQNKILIQKLKEELTLTETQCGESTEEPTVTTTEEPKKKIKREDDCSSECNDELESIKSVIDSNKNLIERLRQELNETECNEDSKTTEQPSIPIEVATKKVSIK